MIHFVTLLTNSYVPGFVALVNSMCANSGVDFRFTVIESGVGSRPQVPCNVEWIPARGLGTFPHPPSELKRMESCYDKCLAWRLPFDGPLIFIDCDIICLRSLEGMEAWDELTAVRKASTISKQPDEDKAYRPSGNYAWNSGVFAFRPSEETFNGLVEEAKSYTRPIRYGDQVILNDYFNSIDKVQYVGFEWNMSYLVSSQHPQLFRQTPVRLLHFPTAKKPWTHRPTPGYKRFWDAWKEYA